MSKINAYTTLYGPDGLVTLAPGDTVPDWAEDKIGDHLTGEPAQPEAGADVDDPSRDSDENPGATEEANEVADEGPDFTKPATKRTRTRK